MKKLSLIILMTFVSMGHSQWLSDEESNKIKTMLQEKGVPVSTTLKFYKLDSMYQNMYTMNNGRSRFNAITPWNGDKFWMKSGGFAHISNSHWRNVTGLDLKGGKIRYWQEYTDVRAYSLVPRHRWEFPIGTLAYDVLIRVKDGKDTHMFEARIREKREKDWSAGDAYRPDIQVSDSLEPDKYKWEYQSSYYDFTPELKAIAYVYELPTFGKDVNRLKFRITRKLIIDEDRKFTPPGYVGAGMTCITCHKHAGRVNDVAGRIYREAQPGDDTVFSWHPFDVNNNNIDPRWLLK